MSQLVWIRVPLFAPKKIQYTMNWEDIKFPPINLWSAPRLLPDSPSPEEHSLMVKRRSLLTVKYEKLESDRNRQMGLSSNWSRLATHNRADNGSSPFDPTTNSVIIEQLESSLPCEGRNADSNSAGRTNMVP